MNLTKAIEILTDYQAGIEMEELREYPEVIKLGIEAIKRLQELRIDNPETVWQLLPGETED